MMLECKRATDKHVFHMLLSQRLIKNWQRNVKIRWMMLTVSIGLDSATVKAGLTS